MWCLGPRTLSSWSLLGCCLASAIAASFTGVRFSSYRAHHNSWPRRCSVRSADEANSELKAGQCAFEGLACSARIFCAKQSGHVRAVSRICVCMQLVFFGFLDSHEQQAVLRSAHTGLQQGWQHVADAVQPRGQSSSDIIRNHLNNASDLDKPWRPQTAQTLTRTGSDRDATLPHATSSNGTHEALNATLASLAASPEVQQQIAANALFDVYQALQSAADGGRETRRGLRRAAEGVSAIYKDAFESAANCTDASGGQLTNVTENAAAQCTYSPLMVYRGAVRSAMGKTRREVCSKLAHVTWAPDAAARRRCLLHGPVVCSDCNACVACYNVCFEAIVTAWHQEHRFCVQARTLFSRRLATRGPRSKCPCQTLPGRTIARRASRNAHTNFCRCAPMFVSTLVQSTSITVTACQLDELDKGAMVLCRGSPP